MWRVSRYSILSLSARYKGYPAATLFCATRKAESIYDCPLVAQVIEKMVGVKNDESFRKEAEGSIALLAETLPEFLTIETRPEDGVVVRINRKLNGTELRKRLVELAAAEADAFPVKE